MNEEQQYLSLIIQAYEKGLVTEQNQDNFKLLLVKSVDDLKSFTYAAKKTANKYPGTKHAKSNNSIGKRESRDSTIEAETPGEVSFNIRPLDLLGNEGSDFGDYLEKCFGCETRLTFEFQFLPPDINFLDPMLELLKEIEALLDQLDKEFNSDKMINELCATIDMFNSVPCPQDIMNLIMAIQMLLVKYIGASLQLRLDWFSLLGPILQLLGQSLSLLVNFIFDFLSAPLKCTQSGMISSLSLLRTLDPKSFTTPFIKAATEGTSSYGLEVTSISADPISQDNYPKDILTGSGSMIDVNHKNIKPGDKPSTTNELLIPTGAFANLQLSDLMNFEEFKANFFDLSMPERLLMTLNESLSNLSNLKSRMDQTIQSLMNLTRSNKLLEIKSLTVIIYLLNLISFLILLLNSDWKTLCKDKKNKKALESTIRKVTNSSSAKIKQTETSTKVEITKLDGTTKTISLNTCSMAKSNATVPALDSILKDIERITNGI